MEHMKKLIPTLACFIAGTALPVVDYQECDCQGIYRLGITMHGLGIIMDRLEIPMHRVEIRMHRLGIVMHRLGTRMHG